MDTTKVLAATFEARKGAHLTMTARLLRGMTSSRC
jgi:hypothetical protein